MPRRTKEEALQTRQAILNAALDIFYEKGFSRTTFDEIARRINLTKGAVYWHFRNKADLLAELIRLKFTQKNRDNLHFLRNPQSVAELREMLCRQARSIEQDPAFRKFLFFIVYQMEWSETICQKVGEQVREIRDFPLQQLKEALTFLQNSGEITADVNIDDLAVILLCLWRGTVNAYIGRNIPFNLSNNITKGFDLLIDGLEVEQK